MGQAGHAGRPGQEEVEARRGDADTSRIRDETLAECNRLLTDATRVVHEARVVAEGIKSEMLAEVEEETRRLLAETEGRRTTVVDEARRMRDEILAEVDEEATQLLADAERRRDAILDEAGRIRDEAEELHRTARRDVEHEREAAREEAAQERAVMLVEAEREAAARVIESDAEAARLRAQAERVRADADESRRAALADIDQERDAARGEAAQERTALLRDAEGEAGRVLEEATRQIAAREASMRAEIQRERDAIVAGARAEAARARDELDEIEAETERLTQEAAAARLSTEQSQREADELRASAQAAADRMRLEAEERRASIEEQTERDIVQRWAEVDDERATVRQATERARVTLIADAERTAANVLVEAEIERQRARELLEEAEVEAQRVQTAARERARHELELERTALLDDAAADIERRRREAEDARAGAEAEAARIQAEAAVAATEREEAARDADSLRTLAEADAERIRAAATEEAGVLVGLAQEEADRLRTQATVAVESDAAVAQDAERVLLEARVEADRVLTDALAERERLSWDAQAEAQRIVGDARNEAMVLRAEIERIRASLAAAEAQATEAQATEASALGAPAVTPVPLEPLEPFTGALASDAPATTRSVIEDASKTVEIPREVVERVAPKVPYVREYGLRRDPVEPEPPEVTGVATQPRPASSRRWLVEIPVLAALALVVVLVLRTFVAQAYFIPTDSMQPKLDVGDRIVVDKLSYVLHAPRRGDIVVFDSPHRPPSDHAMLPVRVARRALEAVGLRQPDTDTLVKRVVALPGETVAGRNGKLLVDGKVLAEPYLARGTVTSTFGPEQVGPGKLWVMGDRRATSLDSRNFGPITRGSVVGRVGLKVWPVSKLGRI